LVQAERPPARRPFFVVSYQAFTGTAALNVKAIDDRGECSVRSIGCTWAALECFMMFPARRGVREIVGVRDLIMGGNPRAAPAVWFIFRPQS
jgi:hypothetical protein